MRRVQVLSVVVGLYIFFLLSHVQAASNGCSVSDMTGQWDVTVGVEVCYSATQCPDRYKGVLFAFTPSPDGKSFIGKSTGSTIADPAHPDILKGTIVGNTISGSWEYSSKDRYNCQPAHGTGSFTGMIGGTGGQFSCNYMTLDLTADQWASPPRNGVCTPELHIDGVTGSARGTKRR